MPLLSRRAVEFIPISALERYPYRLISISYEL